MTLSLILRFNIRLRGYSIWSASTSRTIYDQDFEAWAPHSLRATTSTWRTIWHIRKEDPEATRKMFWLLEVLEDAVQVLDACRTRLRRARGLVRPGATGLLIGIECSRVRDSSWMYLTSLIKYPNRHRTSWNTKETTRSCCSRTPTVLS